MLLEYRLQMCPCTRQVLFLREVSVYEKTQHDKQYRTDDIID